MTRSRRQLLIGLLAIPLSILPFLAYGSWTPQGRLLSDQIRVRFDPPQLPDLDAATLAEVREAAPSYEGYVMPLVYHGVGSDTSGEGDLSVSPERFAEQVAALRAAGMRFVTTAQVAEAFSGGTPLPPNAVLLTFDDGRTDAVLWSTPVLEQADAVATMFVITDAAEDSGTYYASWDDLLGSGVWDLQSHTAGLHHLEETEDGPLPALTTRAEDETFAEWRDRIGADLDRADRAITEETGAAPVAFAYPFGAWGGDRASDPPLDSLLGLELLDHYRLAFLQEDQDQMTLAGPEVWPLALRRLEVGDWDGPELLRRISDAARRTAEEGAR